MKKLENLSNRLLVPALILCIPVLLLLFAGASWLVVYNQVQGRLHEIRSAGLPTTLQELNEYSKLPPGVIDSSEEWRKATESAARLKLHSYEEQLNGDWRADFSSTMTTPKELKSARAMLIEMAPTVELVHIAAEAGGMIPVVMDSQGIRDLGPLSAFDEDQIARLLTVDAAIATLDNDSARSFRDACTLYLLAGTKKFQPLIVVTNRKSNQVSAANTSLQCLLSQNQWNDLQLQRLQELVLFLNFREELERAFIAEQCLSLDFVSRGRSGPLSVWDQSMILETFQSQLNQVNRPWRSRFESLKQFKLNVKQPFNTFSIMVNANGIFRMISSFEFDLQRGALSEAEQRCMFLLIAAQRYRLKTGKLPESLEVLIDAFPAVEVRDTELWRDPYDGEPMRFLGSDEGIRIYALGTNLIDDGGNLEQSATTTPLDVGFQLPR